MFRDDNEYMQEYEYNMVVFTVQAAELDLRASTLRDRIAELERALGRTQSAADEVERALTKKSAQLEVSISLLNILQSTSVDVHVRVAVHVRGFTFLL